MPQPIFYIVEIDLPPGDKAAAFDAFRAWYAHVHVPHLYEAGFTCCTSYRALSGGMEIVDIYQADDWSIFESPRFARYRSVAAADPHLPAFMRTIANTRAPYHHVPWRAQSMAEMAAPLAADAVTVWRFDEARLGDAAAWLANGGESALTAAGAHGIRLLRKTRAAPTGGSIRPGAALVVEWRDLASVEAAVASPAAPFLTGNDEHFSGFRLYPWPDDPAALKRISEPPGA